MNMQKTITKTVTEDMLAVSVGSGTLKVLGTPVLAQLYENIAMQLAAEYCDNEFTTVGCFLSLSHAQDLHGRHEPQGGRNCNPREVLHPDGCEDGCARPFAV